MPNELNSQPNNAVATKHVPGSNAATIDSLNVSDTWKERFHVQDKVYGNPHAIKALPKPEKKLMINFWGLFGAFYLLALGLWRPAITLVVGMNVIALILSLFIAPGALSGGAMGASMAYVVGNANRLYFAKKVLNKNLWF